MTKKTENAIASIGSFIIISVMVIPTVVVSGVFLYLVILFMFQFVPAIWTLATGALLVFLL